jgi:hypothetical protein
MKAFLLYLWVGGTVLYALNMLALHLWFDPPSRPADPIVAEQHAAKTSLPSWTSHLPTRQPRSQLSPVQKSSREQPETVKEASLAGSRPVDKAGGQDSATPHELENSVDNSPEKVMVILGVYVHREPNVSSPIEKRYPIGTELELIGRSDGWALIRNPISKQTGWVLEQHYLVPAHGATQVATVEAQTSPIEPSDFATKPIRKATVKPKRKVVPRPSKLTANDFQFRWDPRRPRWSGPRENNRQARRNSRRERAFLFGPP